MMRVFRNKKISILIVAAAIVVLLLVCMLLITLSQLSSLNQNAAHLQAQIKEQCDKEIELNELLQFMQTDEYVRRWAENNGRMDKDDILWIVDEIGKKPQ